MVKHKVNEHISLEDNGVFLLMEDITDDSCSDVIYWILESNLDKSSKLKHLQLIVNSDGGIVSSGFALIDVMRGSRLPVRTVGIGTLASMGLTIFIAGEKGERVLTPNTMIMSHQWSGVFFGKEHELLSAQKEQKILSDMIIKHYKKHTGLSEANVKKYLMPSSDVWLSAKEALKLGLCDKVKDI